MANGQKKVKQTAISPLSLFMPLKQDKNSQNAAAAVVKAFRPGVIIPPTETLHFLRVILIPNNNSQGSAGIMIATIFDGPMNPYLSLFWNRPNFQQQWASLCGIITNPPSSTTSFTDFQNYVNANNLNLQPDLSFGYTASAAQIAKAFPPGPKPTVNPLSLYVPFKQGPAAQLLAIEAKKLLSGNYIPSDTLIHFAEVALIPNPPGSKGGHKYAGFLLLTCFDGPMNPYLAFFWSQPAIRGLWTLVCKAATNAPPPGQRQSLNAFTNYINDNDVTVDGDLSGAYTATLPQIATKFPFSTTIKPSF